MDATKGKAIFIFIIDVRVQSTVFHCAVARCGNVSQIFAVHFDNTHALSHSGMSVSRRGVTWFVRILDLVRRVVLANIAINVNASSPKWLNRTCAACTTSYGSGTQSDTRLTAAGCYTNTIWLCQCFVWWWCCRCYHYFDWQGARN